MDSKISKYIKDAVSKELKFIGYKLDPNSKLTLTGTVKELSADYIGFTTSDQVCEIRFVITNNLTKEVVYDKVHQAKYSVPKFQAIDYTPMITTAVSMCIEKFVLDAQSNGII